MSDKKIAIYWFRQDLRLADNPALTLATQHRHVLPIYIVDNEGAGEYAMGGASRWWLHHSLRSLERSLGGYLSCYRGNAMEVMTDLMRRFDVQAVYWNRCYEPWRMRRDEEIKAFLKESGVAVRSTNASLLWEPWEIHKSDGTAYKVFTPFYRRGCLQATLPREPLSVPSEFDCVKDSEGALSITQLQLLSRVPWYQKLESYWQVGEQGAYRRLSQFIAEGLSDYKEGRNFPEKSCVSKLSPFLHFGEISPNQVWYALRAFGGDENIEHFCSELGWREFSYSQLYQHPNLSKVNLQSKFDDFPWGDSLEWLVAWQRGKTGVPMVDAGMRQLWQTGFMHNRVRMIVGSFLVKNLLLHWRHGERWFWDTLVDADLANNSASWQWIAGCGADAAPYFRVFNPVTQAKKFDAEGNYIRRFIPEIASLPNQYLFSPWEAPKLVLERANVELGVSYPKPIVDLKQSREVALMAFKSLKSASRV